MEEQERLTQFQELLTEAFLDYSEKHTNKFKRKVSDTEFARFLGVSTGSFNQWINAARVPNYSNAIRIAMRLGPDYANRIFDILGYERIPIAKDDWLLFIVEYWGLLKHEVQIQIVEHVAEETGKIAPGSKNHRPR